MKIHCLFDEMVDSYSLKRHPKNRNEHPKDQITRLAKILEYQGWRYPIKVSKQSGFITSGHGRLEAALMNGWETVPVNYQDYNSEEQEYADLQADNAIASWAELDLAAINFDIPELGPDFDIDMLGLKDFKIDISENLDPQCDEDETPELKEEPKSKRGDVYQIGNHRLVCGDSTSIDDVEKLMSDEKADMVFTDPPYNQETEGGFKSSIGAALRKQSAEIAHMCDFDPEMFLNILPVLFRKNSLNAYCFCNKDLVVDYLKWAKASGYSYNILVWKKPTAIPIGGSYRPDVEYLLVFRKSGIFNGALSDVNYSKVLEHKREVDKVHPTMKPVEMIENQLKIASNNGSIVADLFGGSGSTLIACEKTNRKCFMMELDPRYCDVIVARYLKYTGKKEVIRNGEKVNWEDQCPVEQ